MVAIAGAADAPPPGLVRIVLIDVTASGIETILPIEGGVVLNGPNGAGKTTLLRLVPIFYGEEPRRVIPSGGGKLPFADYYLRNDTSYIVFEYRNRFGLNCVVLYRDTSLDEGRFTYRFIEAGYRREFFVDPAAQGFVRSRDIKAQIQARGARISGEVNTIRQYRSILQNLGTAEGGDVRALRELAARFALTAGSRHPIAGIERVATEMIRHRESGGLSLLKALVLNAVVGDDRKEQVLGAQVLHACANWPAQWRGYREVMAHADLADETLRNRALLREAEGTLASGYLAFERLRDTAKAAAEACQASERETTQGLERLREQHQKADGELVAEITRIEVQEKSAAAVVADIEQAAANHERAGTEQRSRRFDELPAMRADLGELRERQETLLGEQKQHEVEKQRLVVARRERYMLDFAARHAAHAEQQRQHEADIEAERTAAREHGEILLPQLQTEEAAADEARRTLERDQHVLKAQGGSIGPTEDETARKRSAEVALQEANDARAQAQGLHSKAESLKLKAQQAFQAADEARQRHERAVEAARLALEALQERIRPNDDSLLAFLVKNQPDTWQATIGKVISPQVLHAQGLNPRLKAGAADASSLFGVEIDTEALPYLPEADTEELQRQQQALEQALARAMQVRDEAVTRLGAKRDALAAADTALQQATVDLDRTRNRLEQARHADAAVRQEIETAVSKRRAEIQERLEKIQPAMAAATTRLNQARTARTRFEAEMRQRLQALEARDKADRTKLAEQLTASLQELDAQRARDIAAIEKDFLDSLEKAGLREAAERLSTQIQKLGQEIHELAGMEGQILAWRTWAREKLAKLQEFRDQHVLLKQQLKVQRAERERRGIEFEERRQAIAKQLGKIAADRQSHAQTQAASESQLRNIADRLGAPRLDALLRGGAVPLLELDTIEALGARVNAARKAHEERERAINRAVMKIRSAFQQAGGERTREIWGNYAERFAGDTAQAAATGVADSCDMAFIEHWYGGAHRDERALLQQQASSVHAQIARFLGSLEDFDRGVRNFNRELQRHLLRSMRFARIQAIEVDIIPTARREDYLDVVTQLRDNYCDHFMSDTVELPGEDFARALEDIAQRFGSQASLRADFSALIDIRGQVHEAGRNAPAQFKSAADLANISSEGLSMLVHTLILVSFVNKMRRDSGVALVWCLDEVAKIDPNNSRGLLEFFADNKLTLMTAAPQIDIDVHALFENRMTVLPMRNGGLQLQSFKEIGL